MAVAAQPGFILDHTFARELDGMSVPWQGRPVEQPALLVLNAPLADELGLDVRWLRSPEAVAVLAGSAVPEGAETVAQAYAGHQFGGYQPRLGDGRALLLGELVDAAGRRRDLHLKGSGRTPFACGGDGLAAVGPMLREFAMGEAMHALGIPTSRALAVVATNEAVRREVMLPGAVLSRVAASHLRVGSFEYAARLADPDAVRRLADYAIARHHPQAAQLEGAERYAAFFAHVVAAQASLVARWMLVGFVHGVLNTDNVTISGETIDYGPCAFIDAYDPAAVFSSIDHAGRYAYGHQPQVTSWNLARLGETLLPLLGPDPDAAAATANAILGGFGDRYGAAYTAGMAAKLGLSEVQARLDAEAVIEDLLALLALERPDFTGFFRALSASLRGDDAPLTALTTDPARVADWTGRWRGLLAAEGLEPGPVADAMDAVNPAYIARNHLVEEALAAATAGDLAPFATMLGVLTDPYTERPGLEAWAAPAPQGAAPHVTFCGT